MALYFNDGPNSGQGTRPQNIKMKFSNLSHPSGCSSLPAFNSPTRGSKGGADKKNRLVESVGGEGGMIRENSTETYIPIGKQRVIGNLMHEAEQPTAVLWDNLEGWGGEGGGREAQGGGDTCMPMADAH